MKKSSQTFNYNSLDDAGKKELLIELYQKQKKSFADIASMYSTYSNRVRRDAKKYKINIRDKSEAQKNALSRGVTKHPTKGRKRTNEEKLKIGGGIIEYWDGLSDEEIQKRKEKAKINWEKMSEDEKKNITRLANTAVRKSSKTGSKLEHFIFNALIAAGYKVNFHQEQILSNTKLQLDIFLPTLNIAIEVDGPSHFSPVWGADALARNKKYDEKKTGLILGKGLVLIRIKQTKDFSPTRAKNIVDILIDNIKIISNKFPDINNRIIEIGDNNG
jgi:very-short-patch-repair endonuclease